MKKLKKTSIVNRHYHIAYINDEQQIGVTTGKIGQGEDHQHQLIYDPARPPTPAMLINPQTGEQVEAPQDEAQIQQAVSMGYQFQPGDPGKEEGTWIMQPGEDGHTHELVEYRAKIKKTKESDEDIISECLNLYKAGLEIVQESRERGFESEDIYKGKQWKDNDKQKLEGLDRACLTINEVGKNIDELIGVQMEQRTDLKFLPQEDGDQRGADIMNILVKKILDACYYPREESKVFADVCKVGFGDFNVYMDFRNSIQGEIKVERFPWDDVVYGPHEKEDLSDCEYEHKSKMQSKATLKMLFPKKAAEIDKSFDNYFAKTAGLDKKDNNFAGTYTDYKYGSKLDEYPSTIAGTIPLIDIAKKEFRLIQCTRKFYEEVTVIFSDEQDFFLNAYGWEEKDIQAAQTIPGFRALTQTKTRFRITKFCGSVVLSDENPADLPIQDFFTVPVYAYRQRGEFWGKIEVAKDPQRELNKRRSQAIDMMNRMSASFWYYDEDTFAEGEAEKFRKGSSRPGGMWKLNDVNNRPIKEEGAEYPAALVEIMKMDQENLQRLMNVMTQTGGANESGALFMEKKKSKLTGNEFLFDNLSFAKQRLGKLLVALIQKYYDADRIYRIVNAQYQKAPFEVGGQDFSTFSKEEIIQLLENEDFINYDVIVSESSFSPSTRLGVAMALFELMKNGAQIPPELPLQFIDIPQDIRSQITTSMQQTSEQNAAQQQESSNTEIVKTLIAKGQYTVTPEKANQLGLVPAPQTAPFQNTEGEPNNESIQDDSYASNLASALAG